MKTDQSKKDENPSINKIFELSATPKALVSRPLMVDSSSSFTRSSLNARSFRQIVNRASPPLSARLEQSIFIDQSVDQNSINRNILIDNATKQGGFLPHDYRMLNTLDRIRHQKSLRRTSLLVSAKPEKSGESDKGRSSVYSSSYFPTNKLSAQRLIIREKTMLRKRNLASTEENSGSGSPLGQANFASDIPSALELMIRRSKQASPMEHQLYESLKRERFQHGRYRLLPITRTSTSD